MDFCYSQGLVIFVPSVIVALPGHLLYYFQGRQLLFLLPFEKGSILKGKNLLLLGANSLFLE